MLPVLIIGTSQHLMNYVRQVCAEFKDICVYKSLDTYPTHRQLDQLVGAYAPEVILFEAGPNPSALEFANAVRCRHAEVGLVGFAEKLVEVQLDAAGVLKSSSDHSSPTAILVPPFTGEEFLQNIRAAVAHKRPIGNAEVAVFISAKGGSGATTTALNVANVLSRDVDRKVLLLEADTRSRSLSLLLNRSSGFEGAKLLDHWRPLDDDVWKRAISQVENFDFLPSLVDSARVETSQWQYQRLLAHARSRYDSIIIDLPDVPDQAAEAILLEANAIYIVCTSNPVSLKLATRRVGALAGMGIVDRKIRIILNAGTVSPTGVQDLERTLGRKIYFQFPSDRWSVRAAEQKQGFLDPSTALAEAVREFAWDMVGLTFPKPNPTVRGLKGFLRGFRISIAEGIL